MKESERLKAILEAENISMTELAERTGTNRNRWSHVKLGAEDGAILNWTPTLTPQPDKKYIQIL